MERFKKYLAALLLVNMILSGGPVALFAADVSDITGVTPVQQDSHSVYNITADKISSDTGFRSYENFRLAGNDIANLIYTGEYSRFVNMVKNQVQIDGMLTTMKDNNFYDGHAIFVSPGGIVIGAEGMVNVGKLSMISTDSATYGMLVDAYNSGNLANYVPGASGYNALITNSAGAIIVNGRVLTTTGSELYAGDITVEKAASDTTDNSVGLTYTTDDPGTRNYATKDAAAERFNSLVNAQVQSATGSTVRSDGTVVISNVKADAKGTVKVSNDSTFAATQYKLVGDDPILVDSSTQEQRNVGSAVLVDNSTIDANTINVNSSSASSGEVTLHNEEGETWSIIWDLLYHGFNTGSAEELQDLDEKIKNLFSSNPYPYFTGGRSAAEIIIANNSNLKARGDMNVTTSSTSGFKVTNATESVPDLLYAFGTSTKSKIRISDSILEAGGKATIDAKSANTLGVTLQRNTGVFLLSSSLQSDAYNFSYFNFATVADTGVDIKGSTVTGAQTDVTTTANATESIFITNSATVGKNMHGSTDAEGKSTGGSGAAVSVFVNNASLSNQIQIKNSTVEAKTGDLNVKLGGSQSLSTINRVVTSDQTMQTGSILQNLTDDLSAIKSLFGDDASTQDKFKTIFTRLFGLFTTTMFNKTRDGLGNAKPEEFKGALFKAGGALTFNNIDGGSNILIDSATLRAAGKMTVLSSLTLGHSNSAFGDATKGMADIVGAGIGVIYDNVGVENQVLVTNNSLLDAGKGLDVDAVTVLPGNKGKLNFGPKNKLISLTLDFEDGNLGKFGYQKKDLKGYWLRAETLQKDKWLPRLYITGYFENQVSAYSTSKGDSFDVSIAMLIAKKDVNTRVDIRNSTLKSADGNIGLKATNTMSVHTGVGILEFGYDVTGEPKQLTDIFNNDGTGGSVMYMTDHSDAEVVVDNSEITAENGDVAVDAANDQFYLNLMKMGSKSDNLGIAGAASVQEVKGNTKITVGNSTRISGNNVKIDAGGGETSDRITIVDINGAYSDSTGGGIAIGAAVNVKEVDRKVDVLVENTDITSRGDVEVNAQSADTFVTIAFAGAYSEGGAQAVAGNQAQADVQQAEEEAAQNVNVNVEEDADAEGGEGEGAQQDAVDAANNAGNAQNRSHFSLAASGSVNTVIDTADVSAVVRNTKIDAQGAVDVNALMDNLVILAAGGVSDSTKIGGGAAANLYLRSDDGKVISAIEDSEVKSGDKVTVKSDDDTDIYSFAAGVGVVKGSGDATTVSLGGSFDYNTVKPDVDAHISGSTISGQSEEKKTDVAVEAVASSSALDFSGGFSGSTGTGLSVGAAIAATADHMGADGRAYISDSTLKENIKDVSVTSSSTNELVGVAVSAAAATKASTDVRFDGSLGIVLLNNDMKSEIRGSEIDASGNVSVLSNNDSKTTNVAGTIEYTGGTTGVGVNGAVVINKQVNRADSVLNAQTGSGVRAGGSIDIAADSVEQLNAIPITAAISKGSSMTASNVVVNIVDTDVSALGKGTLKAEKDVLVNANDETYMQTRGGTVGTATSGEGLAVVLDVTVNFNSMSKSVDSTLKGATVDAGENVSVTATAVDAIGASREGGKDEDELLVRDADGYYSSLRTDKDFTEWNMVFNVGVSTGGGAAVAGSVTVDSVKNDVNASIGADWKPGDVDAKKSSINAKNVNVLAVDTGINNIFAGSAGASGKYAAVGVNAIWSRNASRVGAVIKQNTILNATGDTKIDAKADRDTNFVLIGGSGNMGEGFSFTANGIYSRQSDDVKAGVDYSTIDTGSLSINADNKVDIVKVLTGVTGSEYVAISVEPIVDKQNGYTRAFIDIDGNFTDPDEYFDFYYDSTGMFDKYDSSHYSGVKTRTGGIGVKALGQVDTVDVLVSLTAAQYLGLYGMGVGHTFRDHNSAQIAAAAIESAGGVELSSLSDVDVDNWAMGVTAAYTGAAGAASVISNDIAVISNATMAGSDITAAGDISVRADGEEHVGNTAAALAGSYMGATIGLNLIFNNARSYQEAFTMFSTFRSAGGAENPAAVNVVSGGSRTFSNRTILADLNVFGATANGAAVKTKINSSSVAILDNATTDGDVNVNAEDSTEVNDTSVDIAAGAVGAGIAVNVFLMNDNTTTQAFIKGPVKARNINVNGHTAKDYNQVNVGVDSGIGTVGVNIARAWFGDDPGFDPAAGDVYNIYGDKAEQQLKTMYGDDVIGGGSGAGVMALVGDLSGTFANDISTTGDININASSDIGNISMTNVSTTAGLLDVGVGVHTLGMENSTMAKLAGSNVNAGGNVNISARQTDSADMTSVGVDVAGFNVKVVAGGANAYDNSSVTGAYLENSKVTAGNVSIKSAIDTRADADNVEVQAALGNINVMNFGVVDKAKAESVITGKTDLRTGNLELRSSGAMDLTADATTVQIDLLNIDVENNKVKGDVSVNALIDDADGTIDVDSLNIITDYSKMKVSSDNNLVALTALDVSVDNSKAYLNAAFNSGIRNTGDNSLVVNNKGTTLIETAKPTDASNASITTSAAVLGVHVDAIGVPVASAITRNKAESNTYLQVTEHNAQDLVVNANLNTSSNAYSDNRMVSLLDDIYLEAEGNNESKLSVHTGGTFNIPGKMTLNANHTAATDVSLESISVSLLVDVGVMRIDGNMLADTDIVLGGTINAGEFDAGINTVRNGKVSTAAEGSSSVHVDSMKSWNTVAGTSYVKLDLLKLNSDKISIRNISTNTTDDVSHNERDGLFDFGGNDYKKNFKTKSVTDLRGPYINDGASDPKGTVDIIVENNNIIKDSSSAGGGGFIAFKDDDYNNTFNAETELIVNGSVIKAGTINLTTKSDMRTDSGDVIKYSASGDGFIVGDSISLKTTLNQKNTVRIKSGSRLFATDDITIKVGSTFLFKQYVSSKDDGFMAWPTAKSKLTSNNDNNIIVTDKALVSAGRELKIYFDASGDLYTKTFAKGRNLGSKVKSYADVILNVDNSLDVGGGGDTVTSNRLSAGNYLRIDFMGSAVTNVSHESYAQCNAVVPDTKQSGETKKSVTNTFNLKADGTVESGNDVYILFDMGDGNITSWNHYKRVYYVFFGHTSTKDYYHNVVLNHSPVFNMAGMVSAGYSQAWEMEIDTEGNIVKSVGFQPSNFEFIDAKDAVDLKNQRLGLIMDEKLSLDAQINELKARVEEARGYVSEAEVDELILNSMKDSVEEEIVMSVDELRNQVVGDLADILVGKYVELSGGDPEAARQLFNKVYEDYRASDYEEMVDYVNDVVTDEAFKEAYGYSDYIIRYRLINIAINVDAPEGEPAPPDDVKDTIQFLYYTVDDTHYVGLYDTQESFVTDVNDALTYLGKEMETLRGMLDKYSNQLADLDARMEDVRQRFEAASLLSPEYYEKTYGLYSIYFDDITRTSQGTVRIDGVGENKNHNPDADYPAPLDPSTGKGTLDIKGPGNGNPLQFYIGTGGVKITNYSGRTLAFGSITIIGNNNKEKLTINGKVRNDLILTPSGSSPVISGITISSLLDVNHPLYENNTNHPVEHLNNIIINGSLYTDGDQIAIRTESGDIRINSMNYLNGRPTSIRADRGNVTIGGDKDGTGKYVFSFYQGQEIYAGRKVTINADVVDINGKITAGLTNKVFNVIQDLPVITDPLTGKNILVDLTGTDNNLKAIYRDGTYEMFSIGETEGSLEIRPVTLPISEGSIGSKGSVTVNRGFSRIAVASIGGGRFVFHDIENTRNDESFYPAVSIGNVTGNVNVHTDTQMATTGLYAYNDITLSGQVVSGYVKDADGNMTGTDEGGLIIGNFGTSGGITVEKTGDTEPTIRVSNSATIMNSEIGDIRLNGKIEVPGLDVILNNSTDEAIYANGLENVRLSMSTAQDDITVENSVVTDYASYHTSDKDIEVNNRKIGKDSGVDAKLYTVKTGAYSIYINGSNLVETDAPVVYNTNRNILIKNALGYRTFDTLALAQAITLEDEATEISLRHPHFHVYLVDDDDEEQPLVTVIGKEE